MSAKGFARGQTQILFRYLPEAVFEHDDYGLCRVTGVALGEAEVNREALFDAMADSLALWSTPGFSSKYPDPRDIGRRSMYAVGSPREVKFVPYPQVFTCRNHKCSRTARFSDLVRRGATSDGKCASCGGTMNRLRYVQAHNCGRLEELYLPQQRCPKGHGPEHLAFYDPGRVKQARWYCALCNSDIQALRMTPCNCDYNASLPPGRQAEKYLKVVPTGDPSLYIPHTVAFINFPESLEVKYRSNPDAHGLMLARMWGVLDSTVSDTLKERETANRSAGDPTVEELVKALRNVSPNHPEVLKFDAKRSQPAGSEALELITQLLINNRTSLSGPSRRWLVEYNTLLDKSSLTTTGDVASMLRHRGDERGAIDIEDAANKARDLMGVQKICVVNDFPLALCAFGYTRTSRDPSRTVITPFPIDGSGKIPLFAINSETEALWFQLDPIRVLEWLVTNRLIEGERPRSNEDAWAQLFAKVPGLQESPHESHYAEPAAVAVRTLLHTMSHVFLRRIEWSGFSPSSVGEYLISGAISFILYANRHAETKIGGLTTLFEQRLSTWLWDAVQSGSECVYDPICGDDGGTCAGCTHREHNCVMFNRELSRSTLYGGPLPQQSTLDGLTFREGYWQQAWKVAPNR